MIAVERFDPRVIVSQDTGSNKSAAIHRDSVAYFISERIEAGASVIGATVETPTKKHMWFP